MAVFEGQVEQESKELTVQDEKTYSPGQPLAISLRGSIDLEEPNKEEVFEFYMEENGRYPDEYLLKALELAFGNVTQAARMINVDRSIYYHRVKEVEGFREKMDEIKEIKLDFVESSFFEHIKRGDKQAQMFYLRTQGKDRGYTTQMEIVGREDKPVQININLGQGEEYEDFS